jgi:hypothetical protein
MTQRSTRGASLRFPTRGTPSAAAPSHEGGAGADDGATEADDSGSPTHAPPSFADALAGSAVGDFSLLPTPVQPVAAMSAGLAAGGSATSARSAAAGSPPDWAHAFGRSLTASVAASVDAKLAPLQLEIEAVKAATSGASPARRQETSPASGAYLKASPPRDDNVSVAGSADTSLSAAVTLLETTFGVADPTFAYDPSKSSFSTEAARGVDKLLDENKLTKSECTLLNTAVGAARVLLDARRVLVDLPEHGPDSSLVADIDVAVEACGRNYGRILLRRDPSIKTVAEAERHWDAISTKLDSSAACNAIDGVVVPFAEMQEYLVSLHKEAAQRAKDAAAKRAGDKTTSSKGDGDDKESARIEKLEADLAAAKKRAKELDKRASQFARTIKDADLEIPKKPSSASRRSGRASKGPRSQAQADAGGDT